MIWDHGEPALHRFVSLLNDEDPNIQVDLTFHATSLRYLDLEVYRSHETLFGYRISFRDCLPSPSATYLLSRTSRLPRSPVFSTAALLD